jgi:hypothetical protein
VESGWCLGLYSREEEERIVCTLHISSKKSVISLSPLDIVIILICNRPAGADHRGRLEHYPRRVWPSAGTCQQWRLLLERRWAIGSVGAQLEAAQVIFPTQTTCDGHNPWVWYMVASVHCSADWSVIATIVMRTTWWLEQQ